MDLDLVGLLRWAKSALVGRPRRDHWQWQEWGK